MQKSVRSFQIVSPQNRPKKKSQDKSTMQSRFLAKKKMINWRLPQSLFSRNKLTNLKGWFPITSQLFQALLFLEDDVDCPKGRKSPSTINCFGIWFGLGNCINSFPIFRPMCKSLGILHLSTFSLQSPYNWYETPNISRIYQLI